jgi:hypothetical protein
MRKLVLSVGGLLGFTAAALGDIPPTPPSPGVIVDRIERGPASELLLYTNNGLFTIPNRTPWADRCEKFAVISMTSDKKFVYDHDGAGNPVKCGISR